MGDFSVVVQAVLATVANPYTLFLVVAGTFLGLVFGSLPGLTSTMGVAILIPLTFTLEPVNAMGMMLGTYIGGMAGGGGPGLGGLLLRLGQPCKLGAAGHHLPPAGTPLHQLWLPGICGPRLLWPHHHCGHFRQIHPERGDRRHLRDNPLLRRCGPHLGGASLHLRQHRPDGGHQHHPGHDRPLLHPPNPPQLHRQG